MKSAINAIVGVIAILSPVQDVSADTSQVAELSVEPGKVVGQIDEKIYGQFFEHIYHSANGGLWGEMVWNRSFEELPDNVAKYWQSYGDGRGELTGDAFNNDHCLMIESGSGNETGVEQSPFFIEKGQVYHGSLWVRGDARGGLVVRLKDGDKQLAELPLAAPVEDWGEYVFDLLPDGSANNATLQVGIKNEGKIWLDQVSLMSNSARKTGGFRPDLLEAIADLRPPIIRWPGGAYATYYRWKDGIGPQYKRRKFPRYMWGDQDINSLGTDEFIELCRRVRAEPLIVVNIGVEDQGPSRAEFAQEARDWVEYCNGSVASKWGRVRAANGHREPFNVKYWEIDNEVWGMGLEPYCKAAAEFVTAMKTVDPTIKVAVLGGGEQDMKGEKEFNGLKWDTTVIEKCGVYADYISLHYYEHGLFDVGPANYEAYFELLSEVIEKSANPDMKIYCSEWNMLYTNDMRSGLYAGGLLNVFERQSEYFKIGGPALFLRHASAPDWDNAFINFDHYRWFPGCNYIIMKLWRDHYTPNRIELSGDMGKLNAVATKSTDGITLYIKAVNPTDKAIGVRLSVEESFEVESASMQLIAPDSLDANNSLDNPDAVRPVRAKVESLGQQIKFNMPRWSAGVVTIKGR